MRARDILIRLSPALFCLFSAITVAAEPADWLIPGSTINPELVMPEYLSDGPALQGDELRGRLLFKSTTLLGEKATRLGLSCNSCHPAGHTNEKFFIPGLSDTPGRIDLTNGFWFEGGEDNVFNPVEIPTLRNVAATAPYGTKVIKQTLPQFSRHVIVAEFNGPAPSEGTLRALSAYMSRLQAPAAGIVAPPISFGNYLSLLANPLAAKDDDALQDTLYLLREELGRQALLDPQNPQFPAAAKKLREISLASQTNWSAAEDLFNQLRRQFTAQ